MTEATTTPGARGEMVRVRGEISTLCVTEAGLDYITERWGDWLARKETKTTIRSSSWAGPWRPGSNVYAEPTEDGDGWVVALRRTTEKKRKVGRDGRMLRNTRKSDTMKVRVPQEAVALMPLEKGPAELRRGF